MDPKTSSALSSKYLLANIDPLSLSVKAAQDKKINDSRDFFEQLITDYPTCGRFWKIYIEQELFQRSLLKVLNIDLWRSYLNYVREIKSKMPNYKEKTAQAYDFALDKIGLDVNSYSIWLDYVNFLKSVEAAGSFAENQKITAIRKVYQKGVMNPMINVDQLWKDYCAFENQINPLIAKRMIDDRSREFMTVRKISKDYENVTRYIDRNSPCFPPQGTIEELKQKNYWKKYIDWEKNNPLKSEDPAVVAKRVMFAYEQCLLSMATHPDIYYEATSYLQQMSSLMAEKCDAILSKHYANEAINLYERSIDTFMKKNMLIYFSYCDFEESRLNYTKVKEIYDKILDTNEIDPSLCYIQYMRFLRRVEGIRSARTIFKKARDDPRISYHVFVAAAFMEYLCTKDKLIAYKIFQLGWKMFGHIPEYNLSFIELAKHMNDDENIKNLFETVLSNEKLPKDKTGDIWSEWLQFENFVGNLNDIHNVEKKREQIYQELNQSEERQTILLIDRFKFMNLFPCSQVELKSLGYKDSNNNGLIPLVPSNISAGTSLATSLAHTNASIASLGSSKDKNYTNTSSITDEIMSTSNQPLMETSQSSNPFSKSVITRPRFPVPDISKMYPFKQNRSSLSSLQPLPGGGLFLFPSILADMIKRLPSPACFDGPFVAIDEFLSHFQTIQLPEDFETFHKQYMTKSNEKSLNEISTNSINNNINNNTNVKRSYLSSQASEDDENVNNVISRNDDKKLSNGSMDIYKQRQQKKLVK